MIVDGENGLIDAVLDWDDVRFFYDQGKDDIEAICNRTVINDQTCAFHFPDAGIALSQVK